MRAARSHQRPAYTMLEIILVMVIIVIAAGLSIPLMQTMLADGRITASGDQVRGQMAEARARAMDEGRPWKFGFIAGTGYYQLAPEDSSEWDNQSQEPDASAEVIRDQLPKDIIFALSHEAIFNSAGGGGGGGWETGAVFLP